MYKGRSVAVVVPAYNEQRHIQATLADMPDYIDSVIVVDDGSSDDTVRISQEFASCDRRVELLVNDANLGKGKAVVQGIRRALCSGHDIVALMDGDHQMPADHLSRLLDPLIENSCDATKGNRFIGAPEALSSMPRHRLLGNVLLTIATKLASGYWSIFDSQNGYWAISASALSRLDLMRLARRYDFENSLLINLNTIEARVRDVSIPARYADEQSKIRLLSFMPRTIATLLTGFPQRMFRRYFAHGPHLIGISLACGVLLVVGGIAFAFLGSFGIAVVLSVGGVVAFATAIALDAFNEPK